MNGSEFSSRVTPPELVTWKYICTNKNRSYLTLIKNDNAHHSSSCVLPKGLQICNITLTSNDHCMRGEHFQTELYGISVANTYLADISLIGLPHRLLMSIPPMATAAPRAATATVPAAAFFALRCSLSSFPSIHARCNSAAARLSGLLLRMASHRRLCIYLKEEERWLDIVPIEIDGFHRSCRNETSTNGTKKSS